ncbi:MAG: formylglycine-generating enzyme family protein [Methylomonas sp.]
MPNPNPNPDNSFDQAALTLWSDVLNGMPGFLAAWRRHSGITVNAALCRDVQYLFAAWRQRGDSPADVKSYGQRLRPLLCHSREQQDGFIDFWLNYWDKAERQDGPALSAPESRRQVAEDIRRIAEENPDEKHRRLFAGKTRQVVRVLNSLAVCLLVVWFYPDLQTYWQNYRHPAEKSQTTTAPISGKDGDEIVKPPPPPKDVIKPYLQTLTERQPPPLFRFGAQAEQAETTLLAGGALLFLLPLGWLWYWRRVFFDSGNGGGAKARPLPLSARRPLLERIMGGEAKNLVSRLRFVKTATQRIDAAKTAQATAKQGGYPCLKYAERYRRADFLLITGRRHRDDQSALLFSGLQTYLEEAQLPVRRFYFDRHPQQLWAEAPGALAPVSLADVLLLYPRSRMLLVVEQEVLFYRLSGEPQPWLKELHGRGDYQLALLNRPAGWQIGRLHSEHIRFRMIDSLRDIAPLLDFSAASEVYAAAPSPEFRRDWLGNLRPADITEVMAWIINTHGGAELRFLALLAIYPALKSDLTQALFDCFSAADLPAEKRLNASVLFNVTALPWCRQGWLPRWLRLALLERLSAADQRRARGFFVDLLSGKNRGGRRINLPLHNPQGLSVWLWLQTLLQRAPAQNPLRDAVFAKVMLLPRRLQNALPRRLLDLLPEWLIRQWPLRIGLLLVFAVYMGGLAAGWQFFGVDLYGRHLLAEQRAERAGLTVTIRYAEQAAAALEPLGKALSALGYRVAVYPEHVRVNSVLAPPEFATELAETAAFMTWGGEFAIRTETAQEPQITLAAMPQTGQVFRDSRPEAAAIRVDYPKNNDVILEEGSLLMAKTAAPPEDRPDSSIQPIFPKMVKIPAGKFLMGSPKTEQGRFDDEGPQHAVTIQTFEMAETELTFDEWDKCAAAKACRQIEDNGWGRGKRPVINVSWNDAQDYINWLNSHAVKPYRLPSEAEWEYAARAGTQTPYYWGANSQCGYANGYDQTLSEFSSVDCADNYSNTSPVGTFKANAFGLFDIYGNVSEWVQDCWHDSYANAPSDGKAWEKNECEQRSIRGGSWSDSPQNLRSAYRARRWSYGANDVSGFRLARTI